MRRGISNSAQGLVSPDPTPGRGSSARLMRVSVGAEGVSVCSCRTVSQREQSTEQVSSLQSSVCIHLSSRLRDLCLHVPPPFLRLLLAHGSLGPAALGSLWLLCYSNNNNTLHATQHQRCQNTADGRPDRSSGLERVSGAGPLCAALVVPGVWRPPPSSPRH